jgi:small GTP-binding protein
MIQKKICMLGAFAVGKTSLVDRFVESIFSERYYTTVGVRVERKTVQMDEQALHLIIWDLAGEDDFLQIRLSYLRGATGYLLVADGTRRQTLELAVEIQQRVQGTLENVPFVLLVYKADLTGEWEVADSLLQDLRARGWNWLKTSAKTGAGVEEAFVTLASRMMEK